MSGVRTRKGHREDIKIKKSKKTDNEWNKRRRHGGTELKMRNIARGESSFKGKKERIRRIQGEERTEI